jgi:hypothetical protein
VGRSELSAALGFVISAVVAAFGIFKVDDAPTFHLRTMLGFGLLALAGAVFLHDVWFDKYPDPVRDAFSGFTQALPLDREEALRVAREDRMGIRTNRHGRRGGHQVVRPLRAGPVRLVC